MHMLLCLAWCLRESQAPIFLLSSLLHINISLAISPLLYLLLPLLNFLTQSEMVWSGPTFPDPSQLAH
jgi:hypothetical protein